MKTMLRILAVLIFACIAQEAVYAGEAYFNYGDGIRIEAADYEHSDFIRKPKVYGEYIVNDKKKKLKFKVEGKITPNTPADSVWATLAVRKKIYKTKDLNSTYSSGYSLKVNNINEPFDFDIWYEYKDENNNKHEHCLGTKRIGPPYFVIEAEKITLGKDYRLYADTSKNGEYSGIPVLDSVNPIEIQIWGLGPTVTKNGLKPVAKAWIEYPIQYTVEDHTNRIVPWKIKKIPLTIDKKSIVQESDGTHSLRITAPKLKSLNTLFGGDDYQNGLYTYMVLDNGVGLRVSEVFIKGAAKSPKMPDG